MMSGNPRIIPSLMSISTANGVSTKELDYTDHDELPWGIEETKKKSQNGCFLCKLCNGRTIGRILNINTHVNGLKHLRNLKDFLIDKQNKLEMQIQQKAEHKKESINKHNSNSNPKLMSLNSTSSKSNCGLNNKPNIVKNTPLNTSKLSQTQDESKLSCSSSSSSSSFDIKKSDVPGDKSLSKYSEFIIENDKTDKFAYRCTLCYKKLKSSGSVSNHLNISQHIENLNDEKLIKITRMVNQQPTSEFNDNTWLPKNIYYHVMSGIYSCQLCETRFLNFSSVNEHIYDCNRKNKRKIAELKQSNIIKYGIKNVAGQQNNYTEGTKVNIDNKNNKDVEMVTVDKKKPLINSLLSNNVDKNTIKNYNEESLGPVNFPKWESIKQEDIDGHYDDFEDFLNKLQSSSNDSINIDVKSEFKQKDQKHLPSEKHKNNIAAMDKKSADNNSINIATNQINSIVNNKEKMTEADSTETIDDNKSKEILSNEIEMLSQNRYQCKICFCHLGDPKTVSEHLKGQRHFANKKKKNEENKQQEKNIEAKKSNDKPSLINPTEVKKNSIVNSKKDTVSSLRHQHDIPNAITEVKSSPDINLLQHNENIPKTKETSNNKISEQKLSNEVRLLHQNRYECKICLCRLDGLKSVAQHLRGERHAAEKKIIALKNKENEHHEKNVEVKKSNDNPILNKPTEIKKKPIVNSEKDTASALRHQHNFPNAIAEVKSSPDINLLQHNEKISKTKETSNNKISEEKLSNEVRLLHQNRYECKICLCRLDGLKSVAQHLRGERHAAEKKIIASKNKENEQHKSNVEVLVKKSNDNPILNKPIEIKKKPIVNNEKDTASALRHQYDFPNAITEINSSFSSLNITPLEMNNTAQNYSKTNELRFKKFEDPRKAMMNAEDCEICHIKVPGGVKGLSEHRLTNEHIDNMNKVFGFMDSSIKPAWSVPTTNTMEFNISTGLNLNNAAWPTVIDAAKSRGTVNISKLVSSDKIAEPEAKRSCHICKKKTVTRNDLHTHMSCHFVDRFLINSDVEVDRVLIKTEKEINENLENNKEDLKENEEEIKENEEEITDMQSFLNDLLGIKPIVNNNDDVNNNNNNNNNSDDESSSDDNCDKEDTTKQDRKNKKIQTLKRKKIKDNIIYNGPSKNLNIYEIDNDKIENIKKGITLSMTLDENNIWCFICNEKVKNSLQTFNEHICSRLHERNYEQLMEQHEQYETFNDQLSNFDLAIQYIYEISNSTVQCLPCDIMIMNKSEMIKNHIDTKNHQDKTNTYDKNKNNIYKSIHSMSNPYFYNCQVYWCVICGAKFHNEIEFREHLDKKKHRKKAEEYSHKLIFDYCPTCAVLWYGFPQTFSYHCEGKMHKYHKKDKHFFINELPSVIINDMLVNPDYYADKLVSLIDNFAENERKKEKLVLKDLTNTIKNKYPQAQHYIFGSRLIGLAFENSDIDIYLDCKHKKKSSYFGSSSIEVNEVIKEVEKCLIDKKNDWLIKRVILNARIPIIKLVHRTTLIDCDISFNNGLAVENSNLIKIYCDKNSNCRKLILFIKKWFNYCDLTRISSNAIAWLVIYYLQVQSILPAVIELIEKKTEKRTVAGWEVGVGTDIFTFTEVKDFKKLLKNFFLFYASFDYKDDIICPLLGKAVKKSLFLKPRELPASMKHYVRQLEHGHMLEVDCVMCIQDPFDLGHNITDSVDKFNVYRFMTFCISSAKILE